MSEKSTIKRIALYMRKACDEGDKTYCETAKLGAAFSKACMKRFGESVEVIVYHDIGFSGMHIERPALQRLLQDVQGKRIDIVAYPDHHHLSRDFNDHSMLTRYFATYAVPVINGTAFMREQA